MRNLSTEKRLRPFNQDDDSRQDNKRKHLKDAMEGQKLMLTLATIATQMQRECIKGALPLHALYAPCSHSALDCRRCFG